MNEQGSGLGAGVRIGEYEIVRELGFGGFGITYLARDRVLERLVAVKEYFPAEWGTRRTDGTIGPRTTAAAGDYAWGLERFVDEARVLARLDHPTIVKVHRVVEAGGTAYMVMEYVEGGSLAEELQVSGTLPEARVRALLSGLGEGLAAVHAAGLLHRDIKPANVMLRSRDGAPVLIDFGAAREQMGRQSRSITTVLTPGYAPIEQYSAKGRQGPWTDVYALGALAYAALSGRVPDDATERVLDDQLAPLDTASATPVSGGLARAVEAALAVDMRQRPQDTGEWLALLGEEGAAREGVVAGHGMSTAAPEADARSESWAADEGTSPAAAAEEVAVAAASGAPARRARRRVSPLVVWGAAAVLVGAVAFAVLGRGGDPVGDWESEEAALVLGVEDRVLVQRGLLEAGFDPGEWDGLLGAGTRAALREWQSARDLEATGYLTAATAEVLRTVGEQVAADSVVEAERVAAAAADSIARADAEAQRETEAARQAEEQRLAAERAEAARQAEEQRLAVEQAEAARQAEEQRLAAEQAEAARQAEEQRLAAEQAEAARQAEEQRFATVPLMRLFSDGLNRLIDSAARGDGFSSLSEATFGRERRGRSYYNVSPLPGYDVCEVQIGIVRPRVECISGRQSYLGALRQVIGVLGEPEEQEVDRAEWEIPLYGGITCSVDVNLDDDGDEIELSVIESYLPDRCRGRRGG